MTAAGIFSRTSNGKFSPVSHFGTSTSHKRHDLCEGSAYVHSSVRLYLLVLTRLYTYIFSMSIVFCDSSQYINRNKSNCGGGGKLRCADSRFAEPRSFLKKVFIVAVRSCGCGGLIRGLQNLGSSRKGDGFILFALCKKNQKAHQRFANLWTPGTIQIAGRYEIFAEMSGGH